MEISERAPVRLDAPDVRESGAVASAAMHERIGRGVTVYDVPARCPCRLGIGSSGGIGANPRLELTSQLMAGLGGAGEADGLFVRTGRGE
jgi:hypothetical protein